MWLITPHVDGLGIQSAPAQSGRLILRFFASRLPAPITAKAQDFRSLSKLLTKRYSIKIFRLCFAMTDLELSAFQLLALTV